MCTNQLLTCVKHLFKGDSDIEVRRLGLTQMVRTAALTTALSREAALLRAAELDLIPAAAQTRRLTATEISE